MLIIDGKEYADFVIITGINERSEKLYGEGVITKQNGDNRYDVIGTRLIHTVTFAASPAAPQNELNELFDILSDAAESHIVTLPHGKGEITYNAHIAATSRNLVDIDITNGEYIWSSDISIEFQPLSPQIRSDD